MSASPCDVTTVATPYRMSGRAILGGGTLGNCGRGHGGGDKRGCAVREKPVRERGRVCVVSGAGRWICVERGQRKEEMRSEKRREER